LLKNYGDLRIAVVEHTVDAMHNNERSNYPQLDQDEVRGLDTDMHHVMPFVWGSFRVSQAAMDAYGIVPLSGDAIMRDFPIATDHEPVPSINVWLHGPDEQTILDKAAEQTDHVDDDHDDNPSFDEVVKVRAAQHKGGIVLAARVEGDIETIADTLRAHRRDDPDDAFQEEWTTDEDLRNFIPQMIVHGVAISLCTAAAEVSHDFANQRSSNRVLRRMSQIGGATLALDGATLLADYVPDAQFDQPFSAPLVAAISAVGIGLMVRDVGRFLRYANSRDRFRFDAAQALGDKVSDDVHIAYCRNHFDYHQGRALGLIDD